MLLELPAGDRQLEVGVGAGVAVPGEVLRAGRHAGALQPVDERRDMPGDELGLGAERADADHGVVGVRVHVGHRREVEVDADRRQLGCPSPRATERVSSTSSTTPSARWPG